MRAAVVLGAGIATLLAAEGTLRLLEGPAHERVRVEYGFVEALPGQHDRIAGSLPALLEQIDALQARWDVREDLLKGLE